MKNIADAFIGAEPWVTWCAWDADGRQRWCSDKPERQAAGGLVFFGRSQGVVANPPHPTLRNEAVNRHGHSWLGNRCTPMAGVAHTSWCNTICGPMVSENYCDCMPGHSQPGTKAVAPPPQLGVVSKVMVVDLSPEVVEQLVREGLGRHWPELAERGFTMRTIDGDFWPGATATAVLE